MTPRGVAEQRLQPLSIRPVVVVARAEMLERTLKGAEQRLQPLSIQPLSIAPVAVVAREQAGLGLLVAPEPLAEPADRAAMRIGHLLIRGRTIPIPARGGSTSQRRRGSASS